MSNRVEREAQEWIEEITGMAFPGDSFAESLKDGVILCTLANKIKPGSVPIVNHPPFPKAVAPFKKMENIANFLKAIRALGMKEFEMFGTPDLYDEKNVAQVSRSIHALGRLLQDIMPDAPFPKLGIKIVAKNERHFTEEQLVQSRMAVSVLNLGSSDMGKKAFQDVLAGEGFTVKGSSGSSSSSSSGSSYKSSAPAPAPAPEPVPANPNFSLSGLKKPGATSTATAATTTPATTVPKPTAPPKPVEQPLPEGWEKLKTDDGEVYYYAEATGETTWDKPTAPAVKPKPKGPPPKPKSDLPDGWEELTTDDGQKYYYHEATDTTTWDKPKKLPPGWEELKTDDGKVYYYNETTDTTTWDFPTK